MESDNATSTRIVYTLEEKGAVGTHEIVQVVGWDGRALLLKQSQYLTRKGSNNQLRDCE